MAHHRRGLRRALDGDEELVARIAGGFESAGLDARRVAMLRYAAKLTRTPAEMGPADVAGLRAAGWSDRAVLAMAEVTGYYAYVNRVVAGLGVELENADRRPDPDVG